MMTYEEFLQAITDYLNAPMSTGDVVLTVSLVIGGIIFTVWFVIYLRKEYIRKKAETDTFNTGFAKDLKYPGFYPGGAPEKNEEKKDSGKDKRDKWGGVNDEY